MSKAGETFFTSVGCMDGRVQEPVLTFGQKKFGAKYADTITEAGLVGLLATKNIDQTFLDSIKKKILISRQKHHSKGIIVHGHEECAGNPVGDSQHKKDVLKAARVIARMIIPRNVTVLPVFVKRSSNNPSKWEAEEV